MTGHDVRRIVSSTLDMMTRRAGCLVIMSSASDLHKQSRSALLDMMTGPKGRPMIQARDLRKCAECRLPVKWADIMSATTATVTVGSGRRNP